MRPSSCHLVKIVAKLYGIAKGIDLVFSLPDKGIVTVVIVVAVAAVLPFVIGIGIGVVADAFKLPFAQSLDKVGYIGVLFCKGEVTNHLSRAVPKPHGGNVAGY